MMPTVMLGSLIGVFINIWLPSIVIIIALSALLLILFFFMFKKAIRMFKSETVDLEAKRKKARDVATKKWADENHPY